MLTTSPPQLAGRLRLAITRTARRLRQEAGSELSPSLTAALATIDRHGPMTPSELAERERVQRPTATRVLARLVEAELVVRTPDPDDGRSCLVAATPAGHELMDEVRASKEAFLARRLEHLPEADRATLARASEILERLLEQREDRPGEAAG